MRRLLRDARRGLGPLPHVGEHPGIPFAILLIGAVGRSRLSDRLDAKTRR